MERKSYHSTSQTHSNREQANVDDKRRSTWHSSQVVASKKQPSKENIHISPLKEFVNGEEVQESISTSNQLAYQSASNKLLQQSTTNSLNFELGHNNAKCKSSHVSIIGDSIELPTLKNDSLVNANSCEIPIQSMQESSIARSTRQIIADDQMNSSPYRSIHHSRVNPIIHQSLVAQSIRECGTINNQIDSPYVSSYQSRPTRSIQQSTINEPMVDASNTKIQHLRLKTWKDYDTSTEPPYASTRQSMPNQFIQQLKANQSTQQSTINQSTCQSLASKFNRQSTIEDQNFNTTQFECINQPHDCRSNQQSMIENHFYKDDEQTLQNDSSYKMIEDSLANPSIQQSMVGHSVQQPSKNPSNRQSMGIDYVQQSMVERSIQQSANQSIDDETQVFNTTGIIPRQLHQLVVNPLTQQSMVDCSTCQSMPNQSIRSFSSNPIAQQSTLYMSNHPSIIIDEGTRIIHDGIWPKDLHKQQSLHRSTRPSMNNHSIRQPMANQSIQQSEINKSSRVSTVHGNNMDNQTWKDINQSYAMPSKSSQQSMPTRFVRPSTTGGHISYTKTLESEIEVPSFKRTQQSIANKLVLQSKSTNPNSNGDIFKSDVASLLSSPYLSNRQSLANKSTLQSMTNPSIQKSIANRLSKQSIVDQAFKQSIIPRSAHESIVEEYDPTRKLLYSKESLSSVPQYQLNEQSMAITSAQQSTSNKFIQQSRIENLKFETSDFENESFSNQSPSKSTQNSIANQPIRQSYGNKLVQKSIAMRSMQPHMLDHQNAHIQMFDNEIPQGQQSITTQSMRQSIVQGLNTKILEDEIHPSKISIEESVTQQSHENQFTLPSTVLKSTHQMTTEDPNINLQMLQNEIELIPQSTANRSSYQIQGNRSVQQSMGIRLMRPSLADQEIGNIQMFEDEVPQNHQSMANRLIQQSIANQLDQKSTTTNLNAEAQMLNSRMYLSPIPIDERLIQKSQGNRSTRQSIDLISINESTIENPNSKLRVLNDEQQSMHQFIANRSVRQSQGNELVQQSQGYKLARQSISDGSIHQSTIDDQNLELQSLDDDIQLSRSPYISLQQLITNRSTLQSLVERLPEEFSCNKSMQVSTTQAFTLEPDFSNDDGNKIRERPLRSVRQSIENMSSHHSIEGLGYQSEMLETKVHAIEPSYRSIPQSLGRAHASRRSSFDENPQNQLNEGKFSSLASYSEDKFEFQNNNEEPRLNLKPSQSMPIPSKHVTLEIRSNVQKESLDKFLVGGWDSVTLKIPPEMHSILHDIRNSLSLDNPNLDLEQHMANMAKKNDDQYSANIRILYSGIYNSNQEPTSSDLYEQSQISQTHSDFNSSNCPSCNAKRE